MSRIGNKDLAKTLVDKYGLTRAAAEEFVSQIFEVLNDGLHHEKLVKIKGLGTFKVTSIAPRRSVDVNTGEPIIIEGREKINFTADTSMRDQVNRPFAHFETVVLNDGVDFDEIDQKYAESLQENDDQDEVENDENGADDADEQEENQDQEVADDYNSEDVDDVEAVADEPETQVEDSIVKEENLPEQLQISTAQLGLLNDDTESSRSNANPIAHPVTEIEAAEDPQEDEMANKEERLILSPTQLLVLNGQVVRQEEEVHEEAVADGLIQPVSIDEEVQEPDGAEESEELLSEEEPMESPDRLEAIQQQTEELTEKVEQHNRMLKYGLVAASLLALVCIAGLVYMGMQLEKRNNRIKHLEAQAVVKSITPATAKASSQIAQDTTETSENVDSQAIIAQQAELEKAAQAREAELAAAKKAAEEKRIAEAKKIEAEKKLAQTATQKAESKPLAKKPETAQPVANTANYNKDPRIRTGAYDIVGVERTVTVRSGQTLAGISKSNLGPGMECYVEAVNGGKTEFKAGDKVKIPALKLKKR